MFVVVTVTLLIRHMLWSKIKDKKMGHYIFCICDGTFPKHICNDNIVGSFSVP